MLLALSLRVASTVSPTPSPSIPANPYLEAVEQWPDPPGWFFVAVKVIAVVAGLVVVVTIATAAASWRTRRAAQPVRPPAEWVDLSELDARTSGVERREAGGPSRAKADGGSQPDSTHPDDDGEPHGRVGA